MLKKWYSLGLVFIFQILIWKVLASNQTFSDWWFNTIIRNYNTIISSISSKIDFPIGEIFYAFLVLYLCIFLFQCIRLKAIKLILFRVFLLLNIFLFLYQSVWGMVYNKNSFDSNSVKFIIEDKLIKELYIKYLEKSIVERNLINSNQSKPIDFIYNFTNYQKDFDKNQVKLLNEKWIKNFIIIENPQLKLSKISTIQNHIGILGYYNPFTVESNINKYNTDLKTSFTMAHEFAHQMGFGSENEANFIAYYLGINSDIPEVRYAAYYKTTLSLLFSLLESDPEFVKKELENLPEGIKTDRNFELEYYAQFDGNTSDAFSSINNQFLKSNNQDGVIAYSKFIEIVYYYEYYIKKD